MPLELPEGWREQLPENIRDNGVLNDIQSIDQLAKIAVDARAFQSNAIQIPSEAAGAEVKKGFIDDLQQKVPELVYVGEDADMSNIYDRMGRPKSPDEYELPDIPDPMKDGMASLTAKAHEAGLSKGQMKVLSEQIVETYTNNAAAAAGRIEETLAAVNKHYGEAVEDALAKAATFAEKIGFDDHLVGAISKGHVGVDNLKALEVLMDGFNSPGPSIGDDLGNGNPTRLTPAQALKRREEIYKNKEHPYWDGSSPEHANAIQEVVDLTRAIEAGREPDENEKFRDALLGRS